MVTKAQTSTEAEQMRGGARRDTPTYAAAGSVGAQDLYARGEDGRVRSETEGSTRKRRKLTEKWHVWVGVRVGFRWEWEP